MAQAKPLVPLLATVVLALDEEGEAVGHQLLQICQSLDPLVQARLRLLRLNGRPQAIVAAPLELEAPAMPLTTYASPRLEDRYGLPGVRFQVQPEAFAASDPDATKKAGRSEPTVIARPSGGEPLGIALQSILQDAAHSGGAEPLAQRGFQLVPNEIAVYLVGRADSPLLGDAALTTHMITRSLATQTDVRRYGILMAAPPSDDPRDATPGPGPSGGKGPFGLPPSYQPTPARQPPPQQYQASAPPTNAPRQPPWAPQAPGPGRDSRGAAPPPGYGQTPGYGLPSGYGAPPVPAPSLTTTPDWRLRTAAQPWDTLLSWQNGEPPLLYAFLFEAWDEAGRYHKRPELRFAMAEALFALFATGALEHPDLREALDLSTAQMDVQNGLERFGSIGTSRLTAPTTQMTDYLAHRLAADVLLLRGLLGEAGGVALPETRASIPEEARRDAEKWVREVLHQKLFGEYHALPPRLPPRVVESGQQSDWAVLTISKISPDPSGLFWRWGPRQWSRFPLDDESFWNLVVQNEYETAGEAEQWTQKLAQALPGVEDELRVHLDETLRRRTLGPEGVERTQAFADAVSTLLIAEQRKLQAEQKLQEQQITRHHLRLEDALRRAHPRRGIPEYPNLPPNDGVPQLPRNIEPLAHEVINAAFGRVPLPLTVFVAAALAALFGALVIPEFVPLLGLPGDIHTALTGPARHWYGAAVMLALFLLALLVPLGRAFQLRRWQRRYAEERTLLWLDLARMRERLGMQKIVNDLLQLVERERSHVRGWTNEITQAASELQSAAAEAAEQQLGGPALARDLFIADGMVWEGSNPDALYTHVREQQDENTLVRQFLQHVQIHMGDVVRALNQGTIGEIALEFMRTQLRTKVAEEPFGEWSVDQARETLDRARQAARVLLQHQLAGRPIGKFSAIAISPSIAWVPRLAEERGMVQLPLGTAHWAMVVRFITRTRLTLGK